MECPVSLAEELLRVNSNDQGLAMANENLHKTNAVRSVTKDKRGEEQQLEGNAKVKVISHKQDTLSNACGKGQVRGFNAGGGARDAREGEGMWLSDLPAAQGATREIRVMESERQRDLDDKEEEEKVRARGVQHASLLRDHQEGQAKIPTQWSPPLKWTLASSQRRVRERDVGVSRAVGTRPVPKHAGRSVTLSGSPVTLGRFSTMPKLVIHTRDVGAACLPRTKGTHPSLKWDVEARLGHNQAEDPSLNLLVALPRR